MAVNQQAGQSVKGAACGYYASVGLFGSPESVRGCGQKVPPGSKGSASPSVTLPAGGSTTAVTAVDKDGAIAMYGPAVLFGGRPADSKSSIPPSGEIKVSTKGKKTINSTAQVKNVSAGPFDATLIKSACKASKSSASGSVKVTKGVLVTATDTDGNPTATQTIPSEPSIGLTFEGVNAVGDHFRAVFNEQILAADGTITVNALHLHLLGPNAIGSVVVAQCSARA